MIDERKRNEPPQCSEETSRDADPGNKPKAKEVGGRVNGLDPTRYGDWEKNGRCIDF